MSKNVNVILILLQTPWLTPLHSRPSFTDIGTDSFGRLGKGRQSESDTYNIKIILEIQGYQEAGQGPSEQQQLLRAPHEPCCPDSLIQDSNH